MIGIKLDGDSEFLEILPDTSVSVRLENPLLSDEDKLSPGSYTYPFDLPGSDKSPSNSAKLKNPDVVENNEAYVVQKVTLFASSGPDSNVIPFKKGDLKAKYVNGNKISTLFTFGMSTISKDIKTAKLRDLLNEEIVISTRDITKTIYLKPIQSETVVDITVNGNTYSGDMSDIVNDINAFALTQKDTNKFIPVADLVGSGTSPTGFIEAPFIKLYLSKVTTNIPGPGFTYEPSVNPLDELSLKINDSGGYFDKVNQNEFFVESFDMEEYYDDFDTFFGGYVSGGYPTDKFRLPAFLNTDPYGELGKFNGASTITTSGLITTDDSIKTGDLINGVNAMGLIRNTYNEVIKFLMTVPDWNNVTVYNRVHSWVKHPNSNGDVRYWFCTFTGSGHEPPTDPELEFTQYWTRMPLRYEGDNKNMNSIQPFLRRKYILEKIASTFGFELEGDFFEHPDLENMLEYTTFSLDSAQDYLLKKKFVFWRRSFNLNELVPDITVVEYLKRLQTRYNLGVYFNESSKKVRLTLMEPIAKSTSYNDVTPVSTPVTQIEDLRISGYSITCPKDANDSNSVQDKITVDTAEQDIPMAIGGIDNMGVQVVDGNIISAPVVNQNFGSEYLMRTFYYKGINTSGSFDYPSASNRGTIINEHLETVDALIGIHDMFWKYWLLFKMKRLSVKLKVNFPLRSLVAFDWEIKRRFNRVNYLVKSIDLQITNNGVKITDTELYTLK